MSSSTNVPVSGPSLVTRTPRRRAGALSCAECRRLKLKCSRVFPCTNCQKKGCSTICPDGALTTGKGNRFVLANTEDLHDKIQELSARTRSLEDALSYSHALNSEHMHPLLSESLLQIKRPLERERPRSSTIEQDDVSDNDDAANAIGSLTISDSGQSTFFSTFASSWHLLTNEDNDVDQTHTALPSDPSFPVDIPSLSYSFPFSPSQMRPSLELLRGQILSQLPPADLARSRAENFYRQAAFMYAPVQEADFWDLVYRPIYEDEGNETVSAHTIALLFSILAMGTHLDLNGVARSVEAMHYYHMARASLALESVLEKSSIEAIQAMVVLAYFMFSADIHEPRWMIMGIVTKMVYSMGLHRDPGKWKIDENEAQRRRNIMWEVFSYDSLQSLTFGRPPSFPRNHMDTKYPFAPTTTESGQIEMSYPAWKHRYMADCLSLVHDQLFAAKTPTYKTAKDLDKKLSQYYLPPSLQVPGFGGSKTSLDMSQPENRLLMLYRNLGFCMREITIFYIHRGWFAHALEESPTDPMGSRYSQSVLAAYNSACKYVALVETWYKQEPVLMERLWFVFSHVFSCCIVLGAIASNPALPLAPSALTHLENGYKLLVKVSSTPKKATVLAPIQKLRDRAVAAQGQVNMKHVPDGENPTRLSFVGPMVQREGQSNSGVSHDQPVLGAKRNKSGTPSTSSSSSHSPASAKNGQSSPARNGIAFSSPAEEMAAPLVEEPFGQDRRSSSHSPGSGNGNIASYGSLHQNNLGPLQISPQIPQSQYSPPELHPSQMQYQHTPQQHGMNMSQNYTSQNIPPQTHEYYHQMAAPDTQQTHFHQMYDRYDGLNGMAEATPFNMQGVQQQQYPQYQSTQPFFSPEYSVSNDYGTQEINIDPSQSWQTFMSQYKQ